MKAKDRSIDKNKISAQIGVSIPRLGSRFCRLNNGLFPSS